MNLYSDIRTLVVETLDVMVVDGELPNGLDYGSISVEPPRDPAHGDMATNAAMVLAKPAGMNPREIGRRLAERLRGDPRIDVDRRGGAGVPEPAPRARRLGRRRHRGARRRTQLRPFRPRRGARDQRRVRLGQPDRAAACGPYPRRGLRRRAGCAARLRRLRRHARILHQRRRRPGRRARAVGLPALPRGARPRGRLRGRHLSRRLPDRRGRGAEGQGRRRATSTSPRRSGWTRCAPSPPTR